MQRRLSIFLVLILSLTAMTVTVQAADTATLPQGQTTMAELPMDLQHTIFTSIHGDMASAPSASGTVPEQQAYLKPFNTERFDGFGFSVAVDGDTVVVGAYQEASAAGAAYVFTRDGDTWTQQAYLKADNAEVGDLFGYSVAVDDDTVVVGARFEDGSATTVNGPDDNAAEDAGAAYVFTRGGTTWSQQAYLKADNAGAGDWFGWSVAVDGDTVVVGARQEDGSATTVNGPDNDLAFRAGAAYVFTWGGGTWSQQAYLKADNTGNFGNSVAVDSDTVVVGAPGGSGAAYVFTWGGGTWSQQAYLKADNAEGGDQFGWSVAVDGDTAVMGAPSETSPVFGGAAYVFTRVGTTWSQQAYLKAANAGSRFSDNFGESVAVDGDTVVVGAPDEDGSATTVNGPDDNSARNAGAAYVFTRVGTTWSQQAYLKASNTGNSDQFGWSVAVDGDTAVVGARLEGGSATTVNGPDDNSADAAGAAYIFTRNGSTWSQQAYLKASNTGAGDEFGYSVAVDGDRVVVGAQLEDSTVTTVNGPDDNSTSNAGAAYVFTRNGSTWSQQAYLKASNTGGFDLFGWSVAVDGDTVVVGAYAEDGNATTVNGPDDNLAENAGAAYVFAPPPQPDVDGNGLVTPADAIYVLNRIGTDDLTADVNGDDIVDVTDVNLVIAALGEVVE